MSFPKRMLLAMSLFVAAIAIACGALFSPLQALFMLFPGINAAILAVLAVGLVLSFWQVWSLDPALDWIEQTHRGFVVEDTPHLVAPLARVLASRAREGVTLSMLAMRSLLDTAQQRLAQSRIVPRGLIALLVVLGGVGILWALAQNAGMRALTSSALFALAATVVLGVAHLLAWIAQTRFFAELEDFLSSRAQLPSSLLGGEGPLPAYLEALLKQTAESLSDLQRMMVKGEEERRFTEGALQALHGRLGELIDQLRAEQKLITTLSKNYNDLQPAIFDLATQASGALAGSEEMREHVRNIDLQLGHIAQEVRAVGENIPQTVRQEIRLLAQTISGRGVRAREPMPPHPQDTAIPPKAARKASEAPSSEPLHPHMRDPLPPKMREPKPPKSPQ
jgi:hypothetical protein